jgi:hypothetical protein
MELVVAGAIGVVGTLIGTLGTLLANWWTSRNTAVNAARREAYVEVLTALSAARGAMTRPIDDPAFELPERITADRLDELYARVMLAASDEVAPLASDAMGLVRTFSLEARAYLGGMPLSGEYDLGDAKSELLSAYSDLVDRMRHELGS